MKRWVYLYGDLAERYGSSFHLKADTPIHVVRLLQANFGDFYRSIRKGSYQLIRGDLECGEVLDHDMLSMTLGSEPLHIMPVIEGGAGGEKKSMVTAIAGVALIAGSVVMSGGLTAGSLPGFSEAMSVGYTLPAGLGAITYGQVALLGGILALGGIAQLLAPAPKIGNYSDREDKKTSYIFSGAVNRMEEGGPVPVIYGKDVFVGSTTIAVGMHIEEEVESSENYSLFFVTCDAGVGATIDPMGQVHVGSGGNLTVYLGALDGFELADVLVDESSVGPVSQYSFTNIQSNHSIYAIARTVEE